MQHTHQQTSLLDLSVIIVNYNVRAFLAQALQAVEHASAGLDVEVFVVDNASVDGSVEMVQTEFPHVKLIINTGNVGFGRANNQALHQVRGRYALILNPDTIVAEDTFHKMIAFMDAHPDCGAAGCQILNPDGTFALESRRAFPTPTVAFYRLIGLSRLFPKSKTFGRYNLTYLPRDEVAPVEALSGCCIFVRCAALESPGPHARPEQTTGAGLFDEDFFMYGEDLDWCYRIRQAGWTIYYNPATQIIHYKGESTKKADWRYVRHFYGAMITFAEKHFVGRYSRLFIGLLRIAVYLRAGVVVLGTTLRQNALFFRDLLLAYAVFFATAQGWSAETGVQFPAFLYTVVLPAYAVFSAVGIAVAGGYDRHQKHRLRPLWIGLIWSLLAVVTVSFFAKNLGFSRAVVAIGFGSLGLLLSGLRWLAQRRIQSGATAVLIGSQAEAKRLAHLLTRNANISMQLMGYVSSEKSMDGTSDLPYLGPQAQLRDVIRLNRIETAIFAERDLSMETMFDLFHQGQDLPVSFQVFVENPTSRIGARRLDDRLAALGLMTATDLLGTPRSRRARRRLEGAVALIGLLPHPLLWLWTKIFRPKPHTRLARWYAFTTTLPAVLRGKMALVGYPPQQDPQPDPAWSLEPGLFSILDLQPNPPADPAEILRLYWIYLTHQSAALDLRIVLKGFQRRILSPPSAVGAPPHQTD